ncbi:MAG: hypothetical protein MRZ79_02390 [Bacteroidia bacterium]|nr:hypothetical protein [Bacteroidia bacterium]
MKHHRLMRVLNYFLVKIVICTSLLFLSTSSFAQYYGATSRVDGLWSVGLRFGNGWIEGDVSPQLPNYDLGIYGQKYLARSLDVRFSANAGIYSGQDFSSSRGFLANPVLNGGNNPELAYQEDDLYFQNYQMKWLDACIQLKLNFNRMFAEYGHEDWDAFILMGAGAIASQTFMDAFNSGNSQVYDYSDLAIDQTDRDAIVARLMEVQDGTYESRAEFDHINSTTFRGMVINSQISTGFGLRCKVSKCMALGFLAEYNFVGSDLLDGQQWEGFGTSVQSSYDNDKLLRLGLSMDWEIR